jgi:hypothetical protein
MRKLGVLVAFALGVTAGVIAACHNELPDPGSPLRREVPPQGPRPGPLVPTPIVTRDGGVTPLMQTFQPAAAQDATPDSMALPANPDAGMIRDAATPL